MADGAELSLDDYIKTKKKQGGFNVGKKGFGNNKNASKKQKGRGGGGARGGGQARGNNQQIRNNSRPNNQGQGRQNRRNFQRGGNRASFNRAQAQVQFQGQRSKNRRITVKRRNTNAAQQKRGGFQGNQRIRGGGARRNLAATSPGRLLGRYGNRQGSLGFQTRRSIGSIQPLMARRINLKPTGVRRVNLYGANNIQRVSNKRVVMKLAKKRIQRARLQLAKRNLPVQARAMALMTTQPRVRLGRNGLVTVKNSAEKQLQRLLIQTKIERAQAARNKARFPNASTSRGNSRGQNVRRSPNQRPRYVQQQQQQVIRRMAPSRMYSEEYDPFAPQLIPASIPRGGSMYADLESIPRAPRGLSLSQYEPPLIRTTRNLNYQPSGPDFDSTLNPEIQQKISFIQNRNRGSHPLELMPDFRAPIVASTMKLGDRFKMYMQ